MTIAFVVESPAIIEGERVGTYRVYVATEARALEIASEGFGRSYRKLLNDEIPVHARAELERAASEA